jgi:hypothetical protein
LSFITGEIAKDYSNYFRLSAVKGAPFENKPFRFFREALSTSFRLLLVERGLPGEMKNAA